MLIPLAVLLNTSANPINNTDQAVDLHICTDDPSAVCAQVPITQLLVVYDDLDLPTAKVRLRAKGGHGGHNGMRSIVSQLGGSKDFPRLRIGVSSTASPSRTHLQT